MKSRLILKYACVVTALCLVACTGLLEFEPLKVQRVKETVFTLTATYGTPDTKVAFDEDGLGLSWMPGDCLYLVDVTGNNSTVELTTSITEPSKTAAFQSTSSVLSGDYIVLFGTSSLDVSPHIMLETDASLSNNIILYGNLSISDGQTSASISLKHVFAKFKFSFKNYPTVLSNRAFGMAVTTNGMPPLQCVIGSEGLCFPSNESFLPVYELAHYSVESGMSSLVIPYDYSGMTVIFYFYGFDGDGNQITYEIMKNGIELKAGVNYNVEFDFSKASVSTRIGNHLKNASDFRAAAYLNEVGNTYYIDDDIDFSGEPYIPFKCRSLYGQNHTLSNISIDFQNCDDIGLFATPTATYGCRDLAIKNIEVKGRNYVGGLIGKFINNNSSYSYLNPSISNCIIMGNSSIEGIDYVGGIVGYSLFRYKDYPYRFTTCGFEGSVIGRNFVGGICGYSNGEVILSYTKGTVSGSSVIGGVVGNGDANNCYIIGDVSGTNDKVGGISGNGLANNCYSHGIVSSTYGISPDYSELAASVITSCGRISRYIDDSRYCNYGSSKPFLSGLSYINSDEAYSTQVWKDIDAQCPLLQWQSDALNGEIEIPGFGNEDW